jgi:hypothetical protein
MMSKRNLLPHWQRYPAQALGKTGLATHCHCKTAQTRTNTTLDLAHLCLQYRGKGLPSDQQLDDWYCISDKYKT